MELTQYLYNKKDVETMIIVSLIQRTSFDEVLFWVSEYYYSGYERQLWELLYNMYFDFYALKYTNFYKYMNKKYDQYHKKLTKKSNINPLVDIIKNMYYMKSSHHIFEFRMCMQHDEPNQSFVYRGRKPKWIKNYDKTCKNILYAIDKRDGLHMAHYFRSMKPKQYLTLYMQLQKYVSDICKDSVSNDVAPYCAIFDEHMRESHHKNIALFMIYISAIMDKPHEIKNSQLMIKATPKEIEMFHSYHKTQTPNKYDYKMLEKVCVYPIKQCVHSFNHSRNGVDCKSALYYNWEFFSRNCPLWKSRFETHNATFDTDTMKISFPDDDIHEAFYEKYGLEPDEQTKDTQNCFMSEYTDVPVREIMKLLWNVDSEVLDDERKYHYLQ